MSSTNSARSRRQWLALTLIPGMRPEHWQTVLDQLTDPRDLLSLSTNSLKALRLPPAARKAIAEWQACGGTETFRRWLDAAEESCEQLSITLLTWLDPHYPPLLRHIHGPAPVLFVRGRPEVLHEPQIAIVGSRHASRDGCRHAESFARALAGHGRVITSGLALGADGAAHRGALAVDGRSIGVLASGVDRIYPASHVRLGEALLESGALVSEVAPGTPPRPEQFPRRNRLISGLSQGVLVVEASVRSGSLITARLALEQGREVFAIPGSIHNPHARGCHQLIRQGAKLVESVDDVLEELTGWSHQITPKVAVPAASASTEIPDHLDPTEQQLLQLLSYEPSSTDELCQLSGLPADRLLQSLLLLEMEDLVESSAAGYRKRAG